MCTFYHRIYPHSLREIAKHFIDRCYQKGLKLKGPPPFPMNILYIVLRCPVSTVFSCLKRSYSGSCLRLARNMLFGELPVRNMLSEKIPVRNILSWELLVRNMLSTDFQREMFCLERPRSLICCLKGLSVRNMLSGLLHQWPEEQSVRVILSKERALRTFCKESFQSGICWLKNYSKRIHNVESYQSRLSCMERSRSGYAVLRDLFKLGGFHPEICCLESFHPGICCPEGYHMLPKA